MYYRLNDAFALRGWQNAVGMLVKRPENDARPLTTAQFSVLILCDGQTPLKMEQLNEQEAAALRGFIAGRIVTVHEKPLPIEKEQRYCYYENRFVQRIMWSVTGACNYRCRHCFVDSPQIQCHSLSASRALDMIDQMAACGVMQVELTGGEPLLRPDFWQLVDRLQQHKIFISQIYTNGALVDDHFFAGMARRGLKPRLCFSFDGVDGWHDWMRGVQGAEESTLRAMAQSVRRGFEVYAGLCLHKGNAASLPETVNQLASIGVYGLNISGVTMTPLWQKAHQGYAMDEREYLDAVMDYFPRFYRDGRPMTVLFNGAACLKKEGESRIVFDDCGGGEEQRYLCSTARFAPYLSAEGRLLPCMPMAMCREEKRFPSAAEKGLSACLTDGFFLETVSLCRADLFARNPACGSCRWKRHCGGGCRANALREGNGFFGCDPYQCLIWRDGYKEKLQLALEKAVRG